MKKYLILCLPFFIYQAVCSQTLEKEADSLKAQGLLVPALMKYGEAMANVPSPEMAYNIAAATALLWTTQMRDTSFYFLDYALRTDSTLAPLYNPEFLSLVNDSRWEKIEDAQIAKFEALHGPIRNEPFARELFRMIIRDQGFMYAGNIERRKYMENGGYFRTPAIFPVLAMEEENKKQNEKRLIELLELYGWPTASEVTEFAAAGAALIINHSNYELRSAYFPMLEDAFQKGEAQPLRYAKMRDRLLVEEGKEQLYGTQIQMNNLERKPYPIHDPEHVDKRRAEIGLGPLQPYLKARFNIDWGVEQEE
jgi:hypothetical protein